MSLFDTIKNAIFGHAATATPTATTAPTSSAATPAAAAPAPSAPAAGAAISADGLNSQLTQLASKSGQKLNWQTSIVDLMKLVGLDPSLQNRKQLATELGYKGDMNDSATMNVWLHKAVMDKLAAEGGKAGAGLH